MRASVLAITALSAAMAISGVMAADSAGEPGRSSGKANTLKNVYFGEQHLHAQDSPDPSLVKKAMSYQVSKGDDIASPFCCKFN